MEITDDRLRAAHTNLNMRLFLKPRTRIKLDAFEEGSTNGIKCRASSLFPERMSEVDDSAIQMS